MCAGCIYSVRLSVSDSDKNQKEVIRTEIEISTIPNFVYKKLLVPIDENGEP